MRYPGFTVVGDGIQSGWKAQVAEPVYLIFENCKVPASKILGEEGKAFRLGNNWLPARRIVRGSRCVGAALRLLDTSVEHVKSWQSYGQTIAGWPNMRMALADISTDIQAARLMVYQAACKADDGQDVRHEAAMVKVFATEMLKRTTDRAVLIKGGPAPAKELPLEILCRSMLVNHIAEHALEVQKSIIAKYIKAGYDTLVSVEKNNGLMSFETIKIIVRGIEC
jgi:acyl-CoA dehydrogenase